MNTLVLLHAFPLDSSMYDEIRRPLSDVCTVVTPDFPGFGDGPPLPNDELSLDSYADAIAKHLDAQGIDRVVLGGTSMGGYTAMAFLRRHQQRVSGLLLIDTKAGSDSPDAAAGRRAMADRLDRDQTTEALVELVFPKLLGATTVRTDPDLTGHVRASVESAKPSAAAWAQRAMASRSDSLQTLREFSLPATVVVGEEDVLAPPAEAEAMASALPDATLVKIPRAGHLTPLEAPSQVVEATKELLARVS